MDALNLDQTKALIDAVAANTVGSVYALPAKTNTITWQLYSVTPPSAITASVYVGLTSSELELVSSTTVTTGSVTTINVNGTFIQAIITGLSGGAGVSVLAIAKAL